VGTDIYLSWDKQTKKEKKEQITGWSIDAGDKGYLRASIGMVKENKVLRLLFPNKIWESKKDGELYDFKENWTKCIKLCQMYIVSEIFNIPIPIIDKGMKSQIKMGEDIVKALNGLGFDNTQIVTTQRSFQSAVWWVNSLLNFFTLGYEKQEEKKNPKVKISW